MNIIKVKQLHLTQSELHNNPLINYMIMKYTFYAVSKSEPITEVKEWNGHNWMPKYSDCKVVSLRPYVFETPDGCYTPIHIGHLKDAEGKYGGDFPREFWDYQPCILVGMDYLLANVLDHV